MEYFDTYLSPIGLLTIYSDGLAITKLSFEEELSKDKCTCHIIDQAKGELQEYFLGQRTVFEVPVSPQGTLFQKKVWDELKTIAFGEVKSYLDVALKTGNRNNTRAVGSANGKNPVAILIPCHRVIGSSGKLTGYAGGLWRKQLLLAHEMSYSTHSMMLF